MSNPRVGSGLDIHPVAAGAGRDLVLAGVTIPEAAGLDGHSDADVVVHAVADALLGAVGAGDLGERFGIDRPDTAGADSTQLLAAVVADVAELGWEVGNVDVTVVAQEPRLSPYRERMRNRLAEILQVAVGDVSVKFTTTDRLGTIGRGEGIAAWAVAAVVPRASGP